MSQLIITLISIALIGLVALSTLSFTGDAFNKGAAKAAANTVINGASQVNAANTLYFLDNQADAADVATLVTGEYLSGAPEVGDVSTNALVVADGVVSLSDVSEAVCEKVNEISGNTRATAADDADATAAMTASFGCMDTGASGSEIATFYFK